MVKLTKIYTRTGDQGETHLAGGSRVKKTSVRICAIGTVDELNSIVGWAKEALRQQTIFQELVQQCERIQNDLFNLGSQLAVLQEHRRENTPVIKQADIDSLEQLIDNYNSSLPELCSFILPGGGEAATRFHLVRSVCRRAERELLLLSEQESLDDVELPYLNRLSDWCFVVARWISLQQSEQEVLWRY